MSVTRREWVCSCVWVAVGAALSHAQEARAILDAPLVVLPGDNRMTHLVDFDQDGWVDALSWWYVDQGFDEIQIRGWINDHAGAFQPTPAWQVQFTGPWTSSLEAELAVGDIDADGRLDFAAEYRRQINIYRSNGASTPSLVQTVLVQNAVADLALADINGDGYADLVYRETDGQAKVHLNQGPSQGFSQVLVSSADVGDPQSDMRIGELTGDGVLDLLFVDVHSIWICPLNADGSFGPMQITPTASRWYWPRPAIGDIDGDGDQDAVVFDGTGTGYYELLRRVAPGAWSLEPVQVGGPTTELADLDGDGDLDGICCGGGGSYGTWLNNLGSTFNTCFNDGAGNFSPAFQMRGVGSRHIAGAADFDHDGDVDLIAGRCIYYSRGPLTSSPVTPVPAPVACEQVLVDFDDDGDTDLGLTTLGIQRSDGQVTYTDFAPMMPAAPQGSQFHGPGYPGDFDGDGDIDLIVARFDGGTFAQMELLVNLGGGHYVDGGAAGAPGVSFSLTGDSYLVTRGAIVKDLDGDGDQDLITRTVYPVTSNPKSKIWLNDGQGVFALSQSFVASSVMAVGNLNADAIPDLVCAYGLGSTPNLFWESGNGNGTYTGGWYPLGTYFQTKFYEDEIALDDLDADGDIDIAAVSYKYTGWGELYVAKNNGNGGFTLGWPTTSWMHSNAGSRRVVMADVDGNGYRDLIAWPPMEGYRGCYVFLRTSNGTSYEPPILQAVQPLAFRDVDSDGDQDAFGFAWNNSDNALVLNTTLSGPTSGARRQYGDGRAGTGGCVPTLGASGILTVGHTVTIRIRGGLGGAHGILAGGLVPANQPFLSTANAWPVRRYLPFTLSGPNGAAGSGSANIDYVVNPAFAGLSLDYHAYIADPAALQGLSATNGLEIEHD